LDVNVTLLPEQIEVLPVAVIVGVGGLVFTVTTIAVDVAVHPDAFVTVTV
jgi:hypothetical protein